MRLLLVEDERRMAALLEQGFTEEGVHVFLAYDGEDGLAAAQSSPFDVIVLDVQLPRMDGMMIVRRLRKNGNQTPILMLTARDTEQNVLEALNLGADDYVTKPFSFEILLARVRAISRRAQPPQPVNFQFANLNLNTVTREVTREGVPIRLTRREHDLLELLIRNAGRPVTRDVILQAVWGFRNDIEENTLEAFVKLLRQKVDAPFSIRLIQTVRGVGYCLRLPEA